MKILFFDTETTGLPCSGGFESQPHIVQLGFIHCLYSDKSGELVAEHTEDLMFNPGVPIPEFLFNLHGINDEMVKDKPAISEYLPIFIKYMKEADIIVGHNVSFDIMMVNFELKRQWDIEHPEIRAKFDKFHAETKAKAQCTMLPSTNLCKIPSARGYKWPKLTELYPFLFGEQFDNAHNAMADIRATQRCYFELQKRWIIPSVWTL